MIASVPLCETATTNRFEAALRRPLLRKRERQYFATTFRTASDCSSDQSPGLRVFLPSFVDKGSKLWKPYLKVVARKASQALQVLDRFHIAMHMNKAIDEVRAHEARELKEGTILTQNAIRKDAPLWSSSRGKS